jgi:hypothetical protein
VCALNSCVYQSAAYLTKDPTERAATVSLAVAAREHSRLFPSTAPDADAVPEQRSAQQVLQRMMLMYSKEAEVSAMYAAVCMLGLPVEALTYSTTRLNVKTAFSYVVEHTPPGHLQMRFHDLPGNADDPDGGASDSDGSSGSDSDQEETDPFESGAAIAISRYEENDPDVLGEPARPAAAAAAALPVRTEANARATRKNKKLANMKAASMTTEGAVFPSTDDDNKAVIVTMTVAYSWRPASMLWHSAAEFQGTVEVVRRAKAKAAAAPEDVDEEADLLAADDDGDDASKGRTPNKTYLLREGCPFFATHELRVLSKQRVVKSHPPPFVFPKEFACETRDARLRREREERATGKARRKKRVNVQRWYRHRAFRKSAHAHAVAVLLQHKPWTYLSSPDAPYMPDSLSWRTYVSYFRDLRNIVAFSDYADADAVGVAAAGGAATDSASTHSDVDNDESDGDSDWVPPFAGHDDIDALRADAERARTEHGIGAVLAFTRLQWMLLLTNAISAPEWLKGELMEWRGRKAHKWGNRGKGIACPTDLDLLFAQPLRPAAGAKNADQIAETEGDAIAMSQERAAAAASARAAVANEQRAFDAMTVNSAANQADKNQKRQDDVDAHATLMNAALGNLFPPHGIATLPPINLPPSTAPANMTLPAGTSLCDVDVNRVQRLSTRMSSTRDRQPPPPPAPANNAKLRKFMNGEYASFVDASESIHTALNAEQRVVFNIASRHADEFLMVNRERLSRAARTARCAAQFGGTPSPSNYHLVLGGPGAGKSHLIKSIADAVALRGLSMHMVAFQALPAISIGGQTVHSSLGLRHTDASFNQGTGVFRLPITAKNASVLEGFRSRVRMDTLCMIVLDEVSACNPSLIVHLDHMFRAATGIDEPFGAIPTFLIGDLYQMGSPCTRSTLMDAVIAHCLHPLFKVRFPAEAAAVAQKPKASKKDEDEEKNKPGVAELAATPAQVQIAQLICAFSMITLVGNERAKSDPEWAGVIALMRTRDPAAWPIRDVLLPRLHELVLTPAKVQANQAIVDAPLLVATNFSRCAAAHTRAHSFAVRHGVPIITWRSPLRMKSAGDALTPEETDYVHRHYPATMGLFVRGMEAFVHTVISSKRGLVNGSLNKMESLCLTPPAGHAPAAVEAMDDRMHQFDDGGGFANDVYENVDVQADADADGDEERVRTAGPGDRVEVRRPPFTVNVMVAHVTSAADAARALDDCSLHDKVPIIALQATGKQIIKVCLPTRSQRIELEVTDHRIQAASAATVSKAQVQSCIMTLCTRMEKHF